MSPPVWGATVCSSPWGSPAALPLLSGWISLKGVLAAANPFMQWEKNTWIFTTRLVVLPPPLAAPSMPLMAAASPAFAHLPLPEAEPFSTGCCSGLLQTKSNPLPLLAKLLRSLPSSLWCSNFSPSPHCAFPLHTRPLHIPWSGPWACCPPPVPPCACIPGPSPQHCIPINMPGLDHVARLSVFCTVLLTCFQPDAKLIQPTERAALTLLDFKWRIYTKSAQQHRNNSHAVQRYPSQL